MYNRLLKNIIRNPFFSYFLLFVAFLFLIKRKKSKVKMSSNPKVNDAIHKIDYAVNRFGTDEDLIYEVFESLTKEEIQLLFKDFGTRYYNKMTGQYQLVRFMEGYGIPRKTNLKGILLHELTHKEMEYLKSILVKKGIDF